MGVCGKANSDKEQELDIKLEHNITSNKPVPVSFIEEIKKSICKLIINKEKKGAGTGFFIDINNYKYLITCYHVIENSLNNNITIEIWDKKIFNLKLNNNSSNIYKDLDLVLINIKELNIKNISYLYYDANYIYGCLQYENLDIFTLSYQYGDELVPTSGKFIKKDDSSNYLFFHNIDTEEGSSGSPIILFTKKIIGVHKGYSKDMKLNFGIFIDDIIKVLNKDKSINKEKKSEDGINILDNFDEKNLIEFNKKFNLNIKSDITKLDLSHKYNNCWEYLQKLNLIELKELNLSDNDISDIKFLEKVKFEKLEKLDLSRNENISDYNILTKVNFKELKELNLTGNNISDIKFLENVKFEKLEKLDLSWNYKISDYNILTKVNFKELKELYLSENNISDIKFLEKVRKKNIHIIY